MSPFDPAGFHARRVRELSAAADWASLVRHWLAHQHQPALVEAVAVARRTAHAAGSDLADFLEAVRQAPFDFERDLTPTLSQLCGPEEQATLDLLVLYPRLALCEYAVQFPPEQRGQLFRIGLEAAEQSCQVAATLRDEALRAFSRNVQARGFQEQRQLEEARRCYDEALEYYRALDQAQPGVFRPDVARTLNNLGAVLTNLRQLEEARRCCDEAVELLQQEVSLQPTAYLMERLRAWSNLGRLLTDAPNLGWPERYEARAALREARACAEQIRGLFLDPKHRQEAQIEAVHIYNRLVQTCVDIWQVYGDFDALPEAVEVAEASRARNLMEMLADEALQPADTPPELTQQFRALRNRLCARPNAGCVRTLSAASTSRRSCCRSCCGT